MKNKIITWIVITILLIVSVYQYNQIKKLETTTSQIINEILIFGKDGKPLLNADKQPITVGDLISQQIQKAE